MSNKVKKRLIIILLSALVLIIATLLITMNLRDNIISIGQKLLLKK